MSEVSEREAGLDAAAGATARVLAADESPQVREQKIQLAAAFRIFGKLGFDLGVAGHITARHAEDPALFWVNPLARPFSRMRTSDLLLVDHDGSVVQGSAVPNHSAFIIHSRIHAAMPHVNAVAHAHSTYGVAWASLGRPLEPINQNACIFYDDHIVFDEYFGPVVAESEGEQIAARLAAVDVKAAILQNHGLLTVGRTVAQAAWWFIAMERACQVQLLVEAAASPPVLVHPAVAAEARKVSGGPEAGDLGFRPLFEQICYEQPDLVD